VKQNFYKDVDKHGHIIPGMHKGDTLAQRVSAAVRNSTKQVVARSGGRISASAEGYSEDNAFEKAQRIYNEKIEAALCTVAHAAEDEVYRFVREGHDTVGEFPNIAYNCFRMSNGTVYSIHYFSRMRYPSWLAKTHRLMELLRQKRGALGGNILRMLVLSLGLLPYLAIFLLLGLELGSLQEMVLQWLPDVESQKFTLAGLWLLGLMPYALADARYRGKKNGDSFSFFTLLRHLYFLFASICMWFFLPIKSFAAGEFMALFIFFHLAAAALYFVIHWLIEVVGFLMAIFAKPIFLLQYGKAGQRNFCERLLTLYRLWRQDGDRDFEHSKLRDMEQMLTDIKKQAKNRF